MDNPGDNDDLQLRHYVDVVWRRRRTVVAAMVIVLAATASYTFTQPKIYRSSAEVLLQNRVTEDIFTPDSQPSRGQSADRNRIETEIEIMRSRSVRSEVEKALGAPVKVSISQQGGTNVVAVSATSRSAREAMRRAQTYAETYVRTRREGLIAELLESSTKVQGEIDNVRKQLGELEAPLTELDRQIAAAPTALLQRSLQAQRDALARERSPLRSSLQSREQAYSAQLDNLRLSSSITQSGGAQLVSPAQLPRRPSSPNPKRNAAAGVGLGLLAGIALAFVREQYDDAITNQSDLARVSRLPVIGMVPAVAGWKEQDRPFVASVDAPQSPAAEAYRSLRTSLEFGLAPGVTLIHMTSPDAGDGKTTTVSNLAVSLAAVGRRVVMVDCDLRRPRLHQFFGLENTHGLSSVLQGQTSITNVIQPVRGVRDLALIAAGPEVSNPAELLAHRRTGEAMQALRSTADVILIDGPPVLPVTDARILARMVDAVIVVVTAGSTPRKDIEHAVELLRQIDAPLVGTILNSVTAEGRYGYGYGAYKYHAEPPRKRRFWRSNARARAAEEESPRAKAGRSAGSNGGKRSATNGRGGARQKARKR